MLSVSNSKIHVGLLSRYCCRIMALAIALFVIYSDSFAQQGTLTDNATFPTTFSSLTVQGSSAVGGSADSFVKFKLTPNLPAATTGSFVAKATLTLYVGSIISSGFVNVYPVTSSWTENDATAPTYDTGNPVVTGVPVTAAGSYVTIDLTALAQQWLGTDGLGTGGVPNYGIALVANTADTACSFDSKESTQTSHPAQLTIVLNHAVTADIATSFTGPLAGDVTGTQTTTVVSSIGGQSAANVANGTIAANAATTLNTPNTIVKRDASGNIAAGQISGNLTNATIPGYVAKAGDTMTGTLNLPANGLLVGANQLVLSAGKVGIGTNEPAAKLDISGDVNISNGGRYLYNGFIFGQAIPSLRNYFVGGGNLTMSGAGNTAGGYVALGLNTSGKFNTAYGAYALLNNTTGTVNTSVGYQSMFANTSGVGNVAEGTYALFSNVSGGGNVGVGYSALQNNTFGSFNTAIGFESMLQNTGVGGTSIDGYNVGVGFRALKRNTNGRFNIAIGGQALEENTTGISNTAVGAGALLSNVTGGQNTAVGDSALVHSLGSFNTAVADSALEENTTGVRNTGIGHGAATKNTTGDDNTALGDSALLYNQSGIRNTAAGVAALFNSTGSFNSALGYGAGQTLTNGSNNLFLGYFSDVTAGATNITNSVAIGNNAKVGASNAIVLGGTGNSAVNVGIGTNIPQDRLHVNGIIRVDRLGSAGNTQLCSNASNQIANCSSSLRYKTQIAPFSSGLEIINRLRPISFTWRDHPEHDFGLGAEDVAAIEPLLVTRNAQGQIEGVRYDRISIILVNAIKQQQGQIKQQQSEIESLKKLVCQDHPGADVCR